MKKVLMIINGLNFGGVETYLFNLTKFLLSTGKFKIKILCLKEKGEMVAEYSELDVIYLGLNKKNFFCKFKELFNLIRTYKPEIVHSHLFFSEIVGFLFKLIYPHIKFVVSKYETGYWMKFRHILLEKIMKNFYNKIFCDSPVIKKILLKRNFNKKNIKVVYPVSFVEKTFTDDTFTEALYKTNSKKICMVARFEKVKNHRFLIDCVRELNEYDFKLFLIGEGEEFFNISKFIIENDLENKIFLLGLKKNAFEYIKKSDFVILPSEDEGAPVVLFEAMLAKTLIICSDLPAIKDILSDKINCFMFKSNNKNSLITLLKFILSKDINEFKNIIENAYKLFNEKFVSAKQMQIIVDEYEN